jgi:hypothetical protein
MKYLALLLVLFPVAAYAAPWRECPREAKDYAACDAQREVDNKTIEYSRSALDYLSAQKNGASNLPRLKSQMQHRKKELDDAVAHQKQVK